MFRALFCFFFSFTRRLKGQPIDKKNNKKNKMSDGRIWKYCNVVDLRTLLCTFIATLYPFSLFWLVLLWRISHIFIYFFSQRHFCYCPHFTKEHLTEYLRPHTAHLHDKYAIPVGGDKDRPGAGFAHEISYTLQSGLIYLLCPSSQCAGAGLRCLVYLVTRWE